jgi:hypothetical protein
VRSNNRFFQSNFCDSIFLGASVWISFCGWGIVEINHYEGITKLILCSTYALPQIASHFRTKVFSAPSKTVYTQGSFKLLK